MSIITKNELKQLISNNELILNVRLKENEPDVENASYDLMAGVAICKKENKRVFEKRISEYVYNPNSQKKETATLKPGQMMFVITHELIKMPLNLCATVYSRNSLALKGILALNAGHIDPGYEGPISIKLINLSSVDFTLTLGDPIYTIVFTRVSETPDYQSVLTKRVISKDEMVKKVIDATNISLNNALYDLALLHDFVKKDDFGQSFRNWLIKKFWGIVTLIFASITSILAILASVLKIYEYLQKIKFFD